MLTRDKKLEWSRYSMLKKFDDMFSCYDRIRACDRQTDRQTDILPRHSARYAYASRGNNGVNNQTKSSTKESSPPNEDVVLVT